MDAKNIKYIMNPMHVKTICTSEESYIRCVEYGKSKAYYGSFNLFIKSILAGVFVGLCAHASGIAGGLFYYHKLREYAGASMASFLYSFTFPIAFFCIICTGADLFTGNTLTVTVALYQKKIKLLEYLRTMSISLVGNYIGATAFAFFVSHCSGSFLNIKNIENNHVYEFLNYMAIKKVNHSFGECICLAIGCNMFVCLSLYFIISLKDGSGIIFSVFFGIYAFAIAGYEHIVANMYTLNLALMAQTDVSFFQVYFNNFLPTIIGNCIAGAFVLGFPLYLIYRDNYSIYERMKDNLDKEALKATSIELINDNDNENLKEVSLSNTNK